MARHKRGTAHENPATRARVLAACLELLDEMGRMPGCHLIARRAGVSQTDAHNVRAALIQAGDLPADAMAAGWYRTALEDPTVERPDDPDADEIRARIAEARAAKEATPPAHPACRVPRARLHHATRPGHWRISM